MIVIDKTRPGYDIRMELLSMIPRDPEMATFRCLCADLGVTDQKLRRLIASLRSKFRVNCVMTRAGFVTGVGIEREYWSRAKTLATQYLTAIEKEA